MASRESALIDITPEVLLKAYACGIFPMAESADDPALYWIEPERRGIIPLDRFHLPERLARTVRSDHFTVVVDRDFDAIIEGCAQPAPGRARTWSAPERTPLYGHPGQLLVLHDGRLLCTYGRREAPFGIRACLSVDGGRTWQVEKEIVIRDDLPNGDLGYPTTIEYEPGRLFCCYYGQEPDGVTCVQGTYLSLASD